VDFGAQTAQFYATTVTGTVVVFAFGEFAPTRTKLLRFGMQ
jgi:ribosomal protein S19